MVACRPRGEPMSQRELRAFDRSEGRWEGVFIGLLIAAAAVAVFALGRCAA